MGRKKSKKCLETFSQYEMVLAKVRNHPEWPGQIIKVLGNDRYEVHFYGTEEHAIVRADSINTYDLYSKKKFVTEKLMLREKFRLGIEQLETGLPIPLSNQATQGNAVDMDQIDPVEIPDLPRPLSNQATQGNDVDTAQIDPVEIPHLPKTDENLDEDEVPSNLAENMINTNCPEKMVLMNLQLNMFNISVNIAKLLCENDELKTTEAIQQMEIFRDYVLPGITRLMLFKFIRVGYIFKRLLFFPSSMFGAEKVQTIATDICARFKTLFDQNDDFEFTMTLNDQEARLLPKLRLLSCDDFFEASTIEEIEELVDAAECAGK